MSKPPKVFYPPEVIQERFLYWSSLPTDSDRHLQSRLHAWNLYCDARDGLPEGTSRVKTPADEAIRQLGLFQ